MKVIQSDLVMQQQSSLRSSERNHLKISINPPTTPQQAEDLQSILPTISDEGTALALEQPKEMMLHYSEEDLRKIELLEAFLSKILGRRYRFNYLQDPEKKGSKDPANVIERPNNLGTGRPSPNLSITAQYHYQESEKMHFASKGQITLDDGQVIDFSMHIKYERHYEESSTLVINQGQPADPIVFDLTGEGLNIGQYHLHVDMDLDGTIDKLPAFSPNAGILVYDKDGDQEVTDRSEIVGATLGDGIQGLRQHDEDGNGWLDSGDTILKALKVWQVDADGNEKLLALDEAGVGAIYLGTLKTDYTFKEGRAALASLKDTTIYLRKDKTVGVAHSFDYFI